MEIQLHGMNQYYDIQIQASANEDTIMYGVLVIGLKEAVMVMIVW